MTMRRMKLGFPWQLKLKHLFLLLVVVSLVLILFVWMRLELREIPRALKKINPSRISGFLFRSHLFGDDDDDDEEEEADFNIHIERQWKEPRWRMADVLRHMTSVKHPLVPVFVVEEHYEVLKYWFDAVDAGVIPKRGNTLLHIDGHSDSAPPRDISVVPWFRLPRNHSEVANMMQSNDVFIAGASLAGLINRYIWVWPDWDRSEHAGESDHTVNEVFAGWRTYYLPGIKPFQRHCVCLRPRPPSSNKSEDWECWDDEPSSSEMGGASIIKSVKCRAVFSAVLEEVHENKALELLKGGNWITEEEKVLLDIDEDYFGCQSSVMPLYRAGLTQESINQLSDLVEKFLCVNDVHAEFIADKVFHIVIQMVRDFKANVCVGDPSQHKSGCVSEFEADKALIQMIPRFTNTLKKAGMPELLCQGTAAEVILQIILRWLFRLSIPQLDALSYVGVCLVTAPTSMMFEPNKLHVCHGFNIPSESQVIFHVPTEEENAERSDLLRTTLSLLPQQPRLVTVCRSVRDGYTPWAIFRYIEDSVMGILRSVFSGVTEHSVHFDDNLLGGKKGWPQRYGL